MEEIFAGLVKFLVSKNLVAVRVVLRRAFRYIVLLPSETCKGFFRKVPTLKYVGGTSLVEYDLVYYELYSQDVLECVFVNDSWRF